MIVMIIHSSGLSTGDIVLATNIMDIQLTYLFPIPTDSSSSLGYFHILLPLPFGKFFSSLFSLFGVFLQFFSFVISFFECFTLI